MKSDLSLRLVHKLGVSHLVAGNLLDLLWLLFAVVGLEPTRPENILDASFQRIFRW